MADQLQLRGGTTTEHATFTGALREVTVDTTKKTLVVHDNATAGGTPLAKENLSNVPAGTITSTMIADGTIVNADINAAAAIDLTKLANGALPSGITVSSANITDLTLATADIADGAVTSAKIADGTIVNADVNASAAIAGTKISPDFGSQNVTTTGTDTAASYSPTSSTAPTNGVYLPAANTVGISTGGSGRVFIGSTGTVNFTGAGTAGSTQAVSFNGSAPVNSLVIDSSGRLGVGNSSPGSLLHVGSSAAGITQLTLQGGSVGGDYGVLSIQNGSTSRGRLVADAGADELRIDTAGGASTKVQFKTGSSYTNALTIDASQRVGIGTTSPDTKLVIADASSAIYSKILWNANNTDAGQIERGGYTFETRNFAGANRAWGLYGYTENLNDNFNAGLTLKTILGGNVTERARIDRSGRLLVGTSSSSTVAYSATPNLQVESTSYITSSLSVFNNENGDSGSIISLGKSRGTSVGSNTVVQNNDFLGTIAWVGADGSDRTSVAAHIACQVDGTPGNNDMPGRLVFSTTADGASSPTERMRIKETGHSKFSNTGSYRSVNTGNHEFLNSLNTIGLEVYNTNASLTATVLQISADRNTTNGTYKLIQASRIGSTDVFWVLDSGNVQNVNNSYTGTSDAKLKENIVDASSQWEDIKSLQVRKFNFKEETGNSTHTQIGLIAQEVEQVSPGLVSDITDRDAEGNDLGTVTKSVNYSVLYMKAVKALQEAMERIEQLEAKVAALESA